MTFRLATVLAAALLIAACSGRGREEEIGPIAEAVESPPHLAGLAERLLAMHNRERAEVGAAPLRWDERLAAAASVYGPLLARHGALIHSGRETRPGQGENLWRGTRDRYSLEEMFDSWAREKRLFRPGNFPQVTTGADWREVGHYTQIVWRSTQHVGCAIHRTAAWDYLICRYSPAGNVVGQPVP